MLHSCSHFLSRRSIFQLRHVHVLQVRMWEQRGHQKEVVLHFNAQIIYWVQPKILYDRLHVGQTLKLGLVQVLFTINSTLTFVRQFQRHMINLATCLPLSFPVALTVRLKCSQMNHPPPQPSPECACVCFV